MTRFIERSALRALLVGSAIPYARELDQILDCSDSSELVSIAPVSAANLLPTYETRLLAAQSGTGPRSRGLEAFVAALRDQSIAEMFAVEERGVTGIGIMTPSGDLAAVTLIVGGAGLQ